MRFHEGNEQHYRDASYDHQRRNLAELQDGIHCMLHGENQLLFDLS